jgi:hypothetical protein
MEHSIAARYTTRPAARFVHPSARERERRLGLRTRGTFQAASARATVLRRADLGPLVRLRANWRAIQAPPPRAAASGQPRPRVAMTWPNSVRSGNARRSSAAPAPWRG